MDELHKSDRDFISQEGGQMLGSNGDLPSMLTRLDKLSTENRRLRASLLGISFLAVILLLNGQPSNHFQLLAQTASTPSRSRPAGGMSFGGQRILIGMTRAEAMNRLSKCCKVTGGQNAYFITERGRNAEPIGARS